MSRGVLYVMAKEPAPGFVKTRLCPPLTPARAAVLARAFAADTLSRAVAVGGFEVRLALEPAPRDAAGRRPESGRAGPAAVAARFGIAVEDQGRGDLGLRMERILARGLAAGGPAVVIGTDCPDLSAEALRSAFSVLVESRADVVLVPARDGGYVLVGARRPVPELFAIDAPWGGPRVFESTCDALSRAGCAFAVQGEGDDVDDACALGRLAARLEGERAAEAPRTARLLARWSREGVRF
jgi:rSAM/selenodomain-associated transferase 1